MMAKKSKKPAPKATAKKASKRPAKKSGGAKKPAAKKAATSGPVATGSGLSPLEIGKRVVADFNAGNFGINDELWSKAIVSIEGLGVGMGWYGRKAVDEKNTWWSSTHKIHGASAEGPYVGSTGFSIKFQMDVEDTEKNERMTMIEIGVYTVAKGKIVTEEFMYSVG